MLLNNKKTNILVSFYYMNKDIENIIINNQDINWLIDSGAFSAYTLGKKINIDVYCEWINKMKNYIYKYFMLDVIGNESDTVKNYNYMLKKQLNPIPIYTAGQDTKYIDYYYNHTDYIGLGGLSLPKNRKKYCVYLEKNFIKGRKFHILGCSDVELIKNSKCYSSDSSSMSILSRFGILQLFSNNLSSFTINKKNLLTIRKNNFIMCLLKRLGIDRTFFDKTQWGKENSNSYNVNINNWLYFVRRNYEIYKNNFFIAENKANTLLNIINKLKNYD